MKKCFQIWKRKWQDIKLRKTELPNFGDNATTLSFKLNGKSSLSLKECVEIKNQAFPDKSLDYLFATEEKEEQ